MKSKNLHIEPDLFPISRRVYVSYARTVSQNYQSRKSEFGFDTMLIPNELKAAQDLCQAIVHNRLGLKIGKSRKEMNQLSKQFMGCDWNTLIGSVLEKGEEIL